MNLRTMMACWIVCFLPWETVNAGVWINELVASNHMGLTDGQGHASDWIELYNDGTEAVSLEGWSLTDDQDTPRKWSFPSGLLLPARGYLVVFASGQSTPDFIDSQGYVHTNFALNEQGEYLALVDSQGHTVHEMTPAFPRQTPDISYGLWQDQLRYFLSPTPGQANEQTFLGFVDKTSHSHERGFYDQPFDLRLFSHTPGASIRFTLDGSEPSEQNGSIYDASTPIRITT
ncbi:MAG: lamin tail domain-containing protein, partial [Candidatus Zophobacter franzmannii]|nr:lamin tail domain-containing protein [Candidatus Zophobacter franzmannii]